MRKIMVDCTQNIPCNPCTHACPTGAIFIGEDITSCPKLTPEKCTGCGLCVAACPGQACFLVDEEFAPGLATVDFPYEYLPMPEVGMAVEARDNEGRKVCDAKVENVMLRKNAANTAIVRISVPVEFARQVRGMRPLHR